MKRYGKAGQWFSPLQLHVLTKLGKMPASEIDQRDLRDIVSPIRHDKADTTWQAVNRLSIVMRYAAALGLEVKGALGHIYTPSGGCSDSTRSMRTRAEN